MEQLNLFISYIVGDFNNDKQIAKEKADGNQIHPHANHTNRICNDKFVNLPSDFKSFFLLEESYYEKSDGTKTSMPHLFLLSNTETGEVILTAYELPKMDSDLLKSSNPNLVFDFKELNLSKNSTPMTYTFDGECFLCDTTSLLPNGLNFRIVEKIKKDELSILELMLKNDVNLLGFDTPIIFNRN